MAALGGAAAVGDAVAALAVGHQLLPDQPRFGVGATDVAAGPLSATAAAVEGRSRTPAIPANAAPFADRRSTDGILACCRLSVRPPAQPIACAAYARPRP